MSSHSELVRFLVHMVNHIVGNILFLSDGALYNRIVIRPKESIVKRCLHLKNKRSRKDWMWSKKKTGFSMQNLTNRGEKIGIVCRMYDLLPSHMVQARSCFEILDQALGQTFSMNGSVNIGQTNINFKSI